MNATFLWLNDITVRSVSGTLFNHLDFRVNKGENWALIGESGSGKSALLQTLAGRFNITGGEVHFQFFEDFLLKSRQNKEHFTYHQLVALVEPKHHFKNLSNTSDFYYQQRYNSSDSEDALTAEQYLRSIKPTQHGSLWDYDKVVATLKLIELLPKQIIKLSNGETKRLMLAAALLKNPLLLLLDNPMTGLDTQTRGEVNQMLKDITASGITVIIVTSLFEIPDTITHIAVLNQGEIKQTVSKADFKPELFADNKAGKIDRSDLQSLLDTTGPAYTDIVKMTGVNIRYGENQVLKNVDWNVKVGERWALLGPNGAGKSTVLSLINGDNPQAYANNIVLFDRKRGSGESIWDIKKKIGFVSPELHQYFPTDNSCLQVIESGYYDTLGLFRPSSKEKAERALRWMKTLEIENYSRTLLKNIPASAQRLCLLARALIKNPDLLIFDEPCQGMDTHQQQHFKSLVDAICTMSNVTLIYVTHYQHEIPDSVTKILRLDKGSVVSDE